MVETIRKDFPLIASFVDYKARVLDVGCDDGSLLTYLCQRKNIDARGIELSMTGVKKCLEAGHSVIKGDANYDLQFYPNKSFDTVILSKTIQAMQSPHEVLQHITRIGEKAIIGFSNFGHISVLLDLFIHRRMPVTKALPLSWFETPNIHFCTIRDFMDLCNFLHVNIEKYVLITKSGKVLNSHPNSYLSALFGAEAVFLVSERK